MRTSKIFVTVDAVVLRNPVAPEILLIKRKNEPFKDQWALPGGFVDENEDLLDAAKRELIEETQIAITTLEQIGAFGKPFRDPRSHVVSVAYFGWVANDVVATAADDAKEVAWFGLNEIPEIAFDHLDIIVSAFSKFLKNN